MKAMVCEAFGGPEVLALREVPDPPPPGPGEITVRIAARGVQYVDVLMLAGKYQFRPEPPFIPGGEAAGEVIAAFSEHFEDHWLSGMRAKLGLITRQPDDLELVRAWLDVMHRNQCDYTVTFRRLCDAAEGSGAAEHESSAGEGEDAGRCALFLRGEEYREWAGRWRLRLAREPQTGRERAESMRRVNPAFIPRNHRVEQVINAAIEREDFAPFEEMLLVLSRPYEDQEAFAAYAAPPRPAERVLQTFCGT